MKRILSCLTLVALAAGISSPLQAKYSFSRGFAGLKKDFTPFRTTVLAASLGAGALGSYWLYNNLSQESRNIGTNAEIERNNNRIVQIHDALSDGKAAPQSVYNSVEWLPEGLQSKIKPLIEKYSSLNTKDASNKEADLKSSKDKESNGTEAEKAKILKSIWQLQQPLLPINSGKNLASWIGLGSGALDLLGLALAFNYYAAGN